MQGQLTAEHGSAASRRGNCGALLRRIRRYSRYWPHSASGGCVVDLCFVCLQPHHLSGVFPVPGHCALRETWRSTWPGLWVTRRPEGRSDRSSRKLTQTPTTIQLLGPGAPWAASCWYTISRWMLELALQGRSCSNGMASPSHLRYSDLER